MHSTSFIAASILSGLASLPFARAQCQPVPDSADSLANVFASLSAQASLATGWKPCNGTLECNRLEVPLDYSKPSGKKATVAVTRSVGKGSGYGKKKTYLINPGGPGISGTATVAIPESLEFFRGYLGEEHDILGWDPRGIGFSTPNITCLADRGEAFAWWKEFNGLFNANDTIPEQWAALKSLGSTCEYTSGSGEDSIMSHASTAVNARDMKSIAEALDGKDAVLNYYGISYGTVYGMTFASMFPDKVGSVILDGNADPANFVKEELLANELVDASSVIGAFYTECAKAGKDRCSFYQKNPKDIEKALNDILAKLDQQPMSTTYVSPRTGELTPFVLTRTLLENVIFEASYSPRDNFRYIADALALLTTGNATGAAILAENAWPVTADSERQFEQELGNLCGDMQIYRDDLDLEGIHKVTQLIAAKLPFAAAQWTVLDMGCRTWPGKSKEVFKGPYGPGKSKNTKGKMLFLNNKFDPVTPLMSAAHYAQVFGGGLLTINGFGHTTLSTFSECSAAAVQAFVKDGTLPAEGKICEMGGDFFPPANATTGGQ